jgi:hypothetical protein
MTQREEVVGQSADAAQSAEKFTQKKNDPFWGIFLTVLICMGAGSIGALSYFGKKNPATPAKDVPGVFSWRPDPRRSPMDIDMPEVIRQIRPAYPQPGS